MKKTLFIILGFFMLILSNDIVEAVELQAKVLHVSVDNHFMVINKGGKDNLLKGEKISIYKADKFLGVSEVLESKEEISAVNTESLARTAVISAKDILKIQWQKKEEKKDSDVLPEVSNEIQIDEKSEEVFGEKKTFILFRPFKSVANLFKKDSNKETKIGENVYDVSKIKGSKGSITLKTQIENSRRKVLFLVNEELKNRGFIVTNYSWIEGFINAQKPMEMSVFNELMVDMKSAVDHRIIYYFDIEETSKTQTNINLNVSASYKKNGKYILMDISKDAEVISEAKEIISSIKNKADNI